MLGTHGGAEPVPVPKLAPQASAQVGDVLDRRYRLVERLGAGGIGEVFAAEHVRLKRRVAVKLLNQALARNNEFRRRFEREAVAASKATHPGCVAVLDVGEQNGQPYLVMELAEGESLTHYLERRPLTPGEAVAIALELLEALRHAHSHGIVHRDIKPDNVMVCPAGTSGSGVKLLDFGLAKNLVPGQPGSEELTQCGTVFGTPSYMSPEQATAVETDMRTDLYSLGVVLYQMACGKRLFDDDDPLRLIKAHVAQAPVPPRQVRPELSVELERVILRALEKDRELRFQSAATFAEALRNVPEANGAQVVGVVAGGAAPQTRTTGESRAVGAIARVRGPSMGLPPWALVLLLVLEGAGALALTWFFYPDVSNLRARMAVQAATAGAGAGVARAQAAASTPTDSAELRQAMDLVRAGELEQAEKVARLAAYRHKEGRAHLLLGHLYYRKKWLSDALKEYRRAIRRDGGLHADPGMIRNLVGCLGHSRVGAKAQHMLERQVGAAAVPALTKARDSVEDSLTRKRAAAALNKLER